MGRVANRNDITIAVTVDGEVYIAQGTPAIERLPDNLSDYDHGLYYSQLPHRAAYADVDGLYRIGTVRQAVQAGGARLLIGRPRGMTGAPRLLGQVPR